MTKYSNNNNHIHKEFEQLIEKYTASPNASVHRGHLWRNTIQSASFKSANVRKHTFKKVYNVTQTSVLIIHLTK